METQEKKKYFTGGLKRFIKSVKKYEIPYQQMCSWNRQYGEGYNDGLRESIKVIEGYIKRNGTNTKQ